MISIKKIKKTINKNLFATFGICTLATNPKVSEMFNFGSCILVKNLVPVIFGAALVLFIWGVVQYILNSQEEAKREKGKQFMIWGIISITVMISIWGLVNILNKSFNIDKGAPAPQEQ